MTECQRYISAFCYFSTVDVYQFSITVIVIKISEFSCILASYIECQFCLESEVSLMRQRKLHGRIVPCKFLYDTAWNCVGIHGYLHVNVFQIRSFNVFSVDGPCVGSHVELNIHIFAFCRFQNFLGKNSCVSHIYLYC